MDRWQVTREAVRQNLCELLQLNGQMDSMRDSTIIPGLSLAYRLGCSLAAAERDTKLVREQVKAEYGA